MAKKRMVIEWDQDYGQMSYHFDDGFQQHRTLELLGVLEYLKMYLYESKTDIAENTANHEDTEES